MKALATLLLITAECVASTINFQSGYGLQFAWQTGDQIGITTGIENFGLTEQLAFYATSTQSSSRNIRSFSAPGYGLKTETIYYAYTPYRWITNFDPTAITCTYDGQEQGASASTAHLLKYIYGASVTTTSSNACHFRLHHLSAILRITFVVPEDAASTETLYLEGGISSTAKLDLKAQSATGEFTASGTGSPSVTLSGLHVGNVYTAYIAIPGIATTAGTIDIHLGDNSLATIKSPTLRAGYLYDIDLTSADSKAANSKGASTATPLPTATGIANPTAELPDILIDPAFTLEVIPQGLLGDINNDGMVMVNDAVLLINYYLAGETDQLSPHIADVNHDGSITVADAVAIVNIYLNNKQ